MLQLVALAKLNNVNVYSALGSLHHVHMANVVDFSEASTAPILIVKLNRESESPVLISSNMYIPSVSKTAHIHMGQRLKSRISISNERSWKLEISNCLTADIILCNLQMKLQITTYYTFPWKITTCLGHMGPSWGIYHDMCKLSKHKNGEVFLSHKQTFLLFSAHVGHRQVIHEIYTNDGIL